MYWSYFIVYLHGRPQDFLQGDANSQASLLFKDWDFVHTNLSVPYCPLPFCPVSVEMYICLVSILVEHQLLLLYFTL